MQASRRGRTADAQPRSVTSSDGCPRAGLNQSATFLLHPRHPLNGRRRESDLHDGTWPWQPSPRRTLCRVRLQKLLPALPARGNATAPLGEVPRQGTGRNVGGEPSPRDSEPSPPGARQKRWGSRPKVSAGGRSRRHDLRYFHGETGMPAPGEPATPIIVFEAPATVRGEFSQCSTQEKKYAGHGHAVTRLIRPVLGPPCPFSRGPQ